MSKHANQSENFIYIRSTRQKIPCTEQQFKDFYRVAGNKRKKEQYYHRCKCTRLYFWACDGDCDNCEHHLGYGTLSLDAPNSEEGATLLESEELADSHLMEDIIADQQLLRQLFQRLRELDSEADVIIQMLANGMSDRGIAKALGIPQRTFADRMKRYRAEFRKIRGY